MSFLKMNHIKQLYNSSANKSGVPEIDVNYGVDKDLAKLVIPWALPDIKKYCFLNAHVIDVVSGVIMKNKQVLTEEGYITRIEDADAVVPEGYYKIECKGKYLCPGLFDNHVHLQCVPGETDLTKLMLMPKNTAMTRTARNAENMLRRGFTSLRDCGGTDPCFKEAINEGSIYGPRLFLAGHAISQTGGHGHMVPRELPGDAFDSCSCHMNLLGVVADGVPQCYKAAREELRRGATFVKIMASGGVASPTDKVTNIQYCEDEIQALVRVAESYGTYVTAHAYTPQSIRHCILNGVKGIEHGNLIDEESAKLMADYGCYLTPTLVSYKIMASDQFGSFLGPENKEKNKMVLKEGLNSLKIAKRNNVKICFGSDLLGSLVGYQTQEFYIRGLVLSPKDVLFSSTVEPANMNDVGHKLGQIKMGYLADILILEENPLENISVLDNPEKNLKLVMKEGRVYQSKIPGVSIDV